MRVPRNLRVSSFATKLQKLGYEIVRERGSHMTLATRLNGNHVIRVPDKSPVAPGTLRSVLQSVADHHGIARADIVAHLDLAE